MGIAESNNVWVIRKSTETFKTMRKSRISIGLYSLVFTVNDSDEHRRLALTRRLMVAWIAAPMWRLLVVLLATLACLAGVFLLYPSLGWGALALLIHWVKKGQLALFAYYLIPLGVEVVVWQLNS